MPSRLRAAHALCLTLASALGLSLALALPPSASAAVPGERFFSDPVLQTFQIEVDAPGLAVLQKNERGYVRATVKVGTNVFPDVGLHLKGMGSFRPFQEKPSIALKFDRSRPKQRFDGLTKLMLNNASQDPTFLAELLATQMFRDAGVPAARVTHAFVSINGRDLGLYVAIEAMNREFLRQYFDNPKGNLYEAYLQDIDQRLDQDGGVDDSQTDLRRFAAVCQLTNRIERWKRLPEVLNVDAYLSHLAVEMFTSHTDGYAMNRNNYRLYHDPVTDRFNFLAHGIDWAFANGTVSIRPPLGSLVTKAVLESPDGRAAYRERSRHLFTNVFRLGILSNRIDAAAARLKAAARNPNEARAFEGFAQDMRQRVLARHESLTTQFNAPEPKPIPFAADGTAKPTGWATKKDRGEPVWDQPTLNGIATLHIRASSRDTIGSWRTKVLLEEGRYRLEGRALCTNVVALTNKLETSNGAGLRVSGDKRAGLFAGSQDWTPLHHDFVVLPGGDEKELVCELRASEGDVWFDAASLRLRRLPPAPPTPPAPPAAAPAAAAPAAPAKP